MRALLALSLAGLAFAQQPDPFAAGMQALEKEQYPDAIAAFERAVAAAPGDYAAHFHLALSQSLAGNFAAAVTGYEKTLELKPDLHEAKLNLGLLLVDAAGDTRAEGLLRAALEAKPDSVPAAVGLGRALLRQGKLAEAEPVLRGAFEKDSRYRDSLLELADAYEQRKELEAAIRLYEIAGAGSQAKDPAVEERLGSLLIEAGRPADAALRLESAVATSPTTANRYALAVAYRRSEQAAKALPLFSQLTSDDPANARFRLAYADLLRDSRQFQPSAEQYFAATKLQADSQEAWTGLAGMLLMLEDYPRALGAYERLESLGVNNAGVHFFKAICQDRMQLTEPALASYRKFLALSQGANPDQEFQARGRVKVLELRRR
jgi:tetratricopeptide (TPR) repeat protein